MFELLDEHRSFRSWPDHRHVAVQDIDELGKLVETGTPQESPETCSPVIALGGPHRTAVLFAVQRHGAELQHHKFPTTVGHPLLPIEHRSRGTETDAYGTDE